MCVIKYCLNELATNQNSILSFDWKLVDESLDIIVDRLSLVFESSKKLSRKVSVISALKEIESQENGLEFLSADKRELLYNADLLQTKSESIPKMLRLYKNILIQLYVNYQTLLGNPSISAKSQFKAAMDNFNKEAILTIIKKDG